MDTKSPALVAAQIHSAKAAERRRSQLFTLSYRGGGVKQITGYAALAQYLAIKETSIPVLLCRGTGASFDLMRPNPLTNEPDICTITKVVSAKEPKRRGRPPQYKADPRLGTQFAESARTVPKDRNRRTDEKRKCP